MKFKAKQMVAVLLAVILSASAFPISTLAAEENTEKEEVVYVNTGEDGTVKEINVVNIFDVDESGKIVDYGKYESTRNMTTTDEIHYAGDMVKIDTSAEKIYYEGKLDSTVIPWKIEIHYYLDGKEYSADEIAGKAGAIKITVRIERNEESKDDFYDSYALQASMSLDTDNFKNINAPDATVANVGRNKQLTYTILPGKGADIEITADVRDFQMDGFSINGIPLNLNVEVDDEELMNQITELLDAIEKIDDGTGEVKDGVEELKDGAEGELKSGTEDLNQGAGELKNGAEELKNGGQSLEAGAKTLQYGAASLDNGIKRLNQGISQVQTGLDALNEQSGDLTGGSAQMKNALEQLQQALNGVSASAEDLRELVEASSAIKTGIDNLVNGTVTFQSQVSFEAYKAVMAQNGLNIEELQAGNTEAVQSINSLLGQVDSIEAMLEEMGISDEAIAPLKNQCVTLANQISVLLNGNNAAIGGMESYLDGLQQGAASLTQGAEELKTKYAEFDTAINTLTNTLANLLYQMTEMKDAVNELVKEYSKLDKGLNAYTDGVAQVVAGYEQVSGGAASLAAGSSTLKSGSSSLYEGTAGLLNGIVKLYDATGTLKDGTGKLDEGAAELIAGISTLYAGTGELKDGTGELREETSGMDTEIEDKIDELLDSISGGESEVTSFVSEKNTNVNSVQFVIKTNGVETEK